MSLIRNEQTRLLANALDRAGTTCLTVGVATPLAGWLYGVGGLRETLSLPSLAAVLAGWLAGALILHMLARWTLNGLKP